MNNMVQDQSSRKIIRVDASSSAASSERSPACASCKHQRKKCDRDCIMAPFFPAEKDSSFKEVHKLFGVSNIQKLIERLKTEKKATEEQVAEAVNAVKWVASSFERDPLSGCYGEYKHLEERCLRLQRQVSLCAFCSTTALTQSTQFGTPPPLPPPHHFNGAAINNWRNTHNLQFNHHSTNRFPNYNNPAAAQISGYLDAAGGGQNLNPGPQPLQVQVGPVPHPFLPLFDAADHSGGLFPPGHNFRLPRTAATSSSPALAASATYYHHLHDHQGRNGMMETKKAKEDGQTLNWGSSSLP